MYTPTLDTASLSDFHITSHCVGLFALSLISTQRQTLRDELVRFSNDSQCFDTHMKGSSVALGDDGGKAHCSCTSVFLLP